jgi:hypothetical protein
MTAVLILFGNSAASIPESDKRCLVNGLRETFGLIGAPIRLSMRAGGDNPYAPKRRRGEGFWCNPRLQPKTAPQGPSRGNGPPT